jgi:GxxExxY protein
MSSILTQADPRTYAIIGAAMEVHCRLGCGFLEPVYQEAMQIELDHRRIPNRPQVELPVRYKTFLLKANYKPDFICFDEVIVELKAIARLGPKEFAQVINYLKATGFRTGLLINFGTASLEQKRVVFG